MELWIRSQKGLTLKKVDQVYIEFKGTEGIYFVRDNSDVLGEYETNERALEVLDKIHTCIQTNAVFEIYSNLGGFANNFNDKYNLVPVYQMPKE